MNYKQSRTARAGGAVVSLATAALVLANAAGAQGIPFAHPAFQRVWDRTDSLVASGQVSRTFFWGPAPRAAAQEQYIDSPTGTQTRLVQYFDKSRMEVNDPNANQNAQFFVTNGLLTIELISGQMQIGNNAFINRFPANIPISGDTDDTQAPTYVSFGAVSNTRLGDHPAPDRTKMAAPQNVTATINKAGQVGNDLAKSAVAGAKVVYFESATRHNIPDVFWQFLNASGPISETGQIVNKRLIDPWFYASGFPISDAYWSRVKIKGEMQDVMIQAYERRVLTYVPTNPRGFEVEMGNIGLHYYDWRYKDAGRPTGTPPTATRGSATAVTTGTTVPTATGTPPTAVPTSTGTPPTATVTPTSTPNVITQGVIAFTSQRSGNQDIWRISADGGNAKNLTLSSTSLDDYPVFSPDHTKIAFTSNRDGNQEIYVMNADGSAPTRLTNNPGKDYSPTWSPDGSKIAFVSERNDLAADIYVMNSNGTGTVNITQHVAIDGEPSWGSAGRIVFTSNRSGGRQLYTMNPDGTQLTGPITAGGDNFWGRWNNRGNRIVFVSTRDSGNQEIYISGGGGQDPTRLTNNSFEDWDPSFSPDDRRIVFDSSRLSGNVDLYIMNVDGTEELRITVEQGTDNHPSWGIKTTP